MANAPHLPLKEKVYQPGEIIHDRYRIGGVLGRGVAITYSAIDLQTNSSVALKVISLKQLSDWKQIELFQREAEVLAKLDYPAIPKYIDYFDIETKTDKAFCLVQQQAPGKSLAQLVASGWRTSEKDVKNIAQQVLSILIYLHSLEPPVIHRDIKPNNLIRSDEGKIYLVDFGAVQNTYYNTLMQGSTVVGTYGYMAPEQFRGQALSATDLYSLGATLLYLLTHRSPAELPQDTLKLNFRSSVNISESFANWLEQIIEPDLEDRFADAEVALDQLSAIKKVKQKKLLTRLGIGVLIVGAIAGLNSYKWGVLSRLGFYPDDLCYPYVARNFIRQGGIVDPIETEEKVSIVLCMIKQKGQKTGGWKKSAEAFEKLLDVDNISEKINEPNENKITLLEVAIVFGVLEIDGYETNELLINLIISLGANVNLKDSYTLVSNGSTPLVGVYNPDIAELLIKYGTDVSAKNNYGETPLFYASNQYVASLLIEHGADVNAKDNRGETPLFFGSNRRIASLLIEHGADVNAKDKNGQTPLFSIYDRDIAELLIKHRADVHVRDNYGQTPLFEASEEVAKLLIEHGADVHVRDNNSQTPLFAASYRDVASLLIEYGANVNAKDNTGKTPFIKAKEELAKLLIEHEASVNAKDNASETAFIKTKIKTKEELAKFLIEQGADVNVRK